MEMYQMAERARELVHCLADELSREVFWARLRMDIQGRLDDLTSLSCLCNNMTEEERKQLKEQWQTYKTRIVENAGGTVLSSMEPE